jgi:hypothetical protein
MNAFAASFVALLSALDAKRAAAARSEAPQASSPPILPCPVSTLCAAARNDSRCAHPACRACFRG